jgi:hypothetical protein
MLLFPALEKTQYVLEVQPCGLGVHTPIPVLDSQGLFARRPCPWSAGIFHLMQELDRCWRLGCAGGPGGAVLMLGGKVISGEGCWSTSYVVAGMSICTS